MFKSFEEIQKLEKELQLPFWECVLVSECKESGEEKEAVFDRMKHMYTMMVQADCEYEKDLYSRSGLAGGDGEKISTARKEGRLLCGDFMGRVMERAVKMGESNACMKRIVAAPTAGSCGVLPAVLITIQEERNLSGEEMTKALFVAAGIGDVIASRAFLAGAAGGCQAEIGSASSMAAGAVAYLLGGNSEKIASAAALAMKNLLGLACDPVAGLVEVPCVKRNVLGAVNALTSADLAMAGVISKIPVDEVYDAMRTIGKNMPENVKETGLGGLANTPTGNSLKEKIERM